VFCDRLFIIRAETSGIITRDLVIKCVSGWEVDGSDSGLCSMTDL
jgi:hypothetical protein